MDQKIILPGVILKEHFRNNHLDKTEVAKMIGLGRQTINLYFKNDNIGTKPLTRLCYALKHNFFTELAEQLPAEFGPLPSKSVEYEKQIALLEEEIKVLKIQNELLLRIKGN